MSFPGSDPNSILIKQSSTSMLLQALIVELVESGIIRDENLARIKQRSLSYAQILKDNSASGAQVAGARIEQDLKMVFEMLSYK